MSTQPDSVLLQEYPELEDISQLFQERLYYDVFMTMETFLNSPTAKSRECLLYLQSVMMPEKDKIDVFNRLELGFNMHSLEFTALSLKISNCIKAFNPGESINYLTDALAFLEAVRMDMQKNREGHEEEIQQEFIEAELTLKMALATLKYESGIKNEAKDILREGEEYIMRRKARNFKVDSQLYRQYYWLGMNYYRDTTDATQYLDVALKYLMYQPYQELESKIQMGLARDITHAAIFSEDTFNFGKVLFHPIMKCLRDSAYENLFLILRAFDQGDIQAFENLKVEFCKRNELVESQVNLLEEKMRLMALTVMCWKLDSSDRKLSFRQIKQQCHITNERVEFAIMKAMSKNLIEGEIDQVKQEVTVTKVQPRDIDAHGIGELMTKVTSWIDSIDTLVANYDLQTEG